MLFGYLVEIYEYYQKLILQFLIFRKKILKTLENALILTILVGLNSEIGWVENMVNTILLEFETTTKRKSSVVGS